MKREIRQLLKDLEERGEAHDAVEFVRSRKFLNLDPDTAEVVSMLARSSGAKRVLEIGTSNGYSTVWLAASVAPVGGHVVTVDRNPDKQKLARENLSSAGLLEYVDFACGNATEVVAELPGPFDFVFFDADRVDAHKQLKIILPKLALPAFLLSDNALSHPDELADYLTAIKGINGIQHVVIPVGKGLSVAFLGSN